MAIPILPAMMIGGAVAPEALKFLGNLGLPMLGEAGESMADYMQMPGDYMRGHLSGRGWDRVGTNEFLDQLLGTGMIPNPDYSPPIQQPAAGPSAFVQGRPASRYGTPGGTLSMPEINEPFVGDPGQFSITRGRPDISRRGRVPGEGEFGNMSPVGGAMGLPSPEAAASVPQMIPGPGKDHGMILNFLASTLTDPLNWGGFAAGTVGGAMARNSLRGIDDIANLERQIGSIERISDAANVGKSLTGTSDDMLSLAMKGMADTPAYSSAQQAGMAPFAFDAMGGYAPKASRGSELSSSRFLGQDFGASDLPSAGEGVSLSTARFLQPKVAREMGVAVPAAPPALEPMNMYSPPPTPVSAGVPLTQKLGGGWENFATAPPAPPPLVPTPSAAGMAQVQGLLGGQTFNPVTFKRLAPEAVEMANRLGVSGELGPQATFPFGRPGFLQGSGGTMRVRPEFRDMQFDDLLVGGGRYQQPKNVSELLGQEGVAGLDDLMLSHPTEMQTAWTIGGEPIKIPAPVDLLNLPMEEAGDLASQILAAKRAKLAGMDQPSALIQALHRMGFSPNWGFRR